MTPPPHRLFLIDGMAIVYRAHFALIRSPIYTSKRVNTSALFGFANTLLELIEKQAPTHLAVAFDTSAPTPRHVRYPEYKAQRDEMPEDIARQIPEVKRLVRAFDIPVIELDGFEADDVIGTLARKAEAEGDVEVYMVTPDKDFAQLVTDAVRIYKPGRQGSEVEILDRAAVCAQWGVSDPLQTIDVLGLWGDASDNIPGVTGVGEKTAKKLVAQYGSVEALLDRADEVKGKIGETLKVQREQALLSKWLVTIITDAPVELDWDALRIGKRDDEALKSLFVEFEFNSLGKRLFGAEFQAGRGHAVTESDLGLQAELKTIRDFEKDYRAIPASDAAARTALLAELAGREAYCFDLETTSLDEKTAEIIGIAFSSAPHTGSYVEIPRGEAAAAVLEEFRPLFEKAGPEKTGHNLKFDLGVLCWRGIRVAGPFFDTMLAHTLIEPEQRHKMDYIAESFLGYTPISFASVFGKKPEPSGQLSLFDEAEMSGGGAVGGDGGGDEADESAGGPSLETIAEYACEDADVTWQLAAILRERIAEHRQEKVLYEIECPLLPVLVAMEREGIRVDPAALETVGETLAERIGTLQRAVFEAAGTEFNINSPKQVGEIFFDRLRLVDSPKKTKTGQYKTDEQTLSSLAAAHPVVRDLLAHREAAKLKSTYVDALPAAIFPGTGRIHTTFHQLLTATGRLASNHPNLQNIPIRSEQGREIRRAFVPREAGWLLLAADYSQIELRVMASLCGDPAMTEAFLAGEDIHNATAARVFGVAPGEVTSAMRRTAKMVNFGIIYGISAFGLSQRLNGEVSRTEAAGIIEEYFRQYPGVKDYQAQVIEQARSDGYVETLAGRRRYLPDIDSRNGAIRSAAERTAINTPIQGTAADMIKIAMVRVADFLDGGGYRSRMLLQVHDELVFDLLEEERDAVLVGVESAMKSALPLAVPVVVECGLGSNWLEAH